MLLARSWGNLNSLILSLGNQGNKSVLLGYVDSVIGNTSRAREVVEQQFQTIGDG